MMKLAPTCAQYGVGFLKTIRTAWLSMRSTRSTRSHVPRVVAVVAGSAAYSHVKITSAAVNGCPSCHTTSRLRRQMVESPSRATAPFSTLGTSCASTGTIVPSASKEISGS